MEKRLLACGIGGTNISAELHFVYLPILDLPFEMRLYESLIRLAMERTQSRSNPRTKVNPRRSDSRRICDSQDTTPPEPLVFRLYTKKSHSSPVVIQPRKVLNLRQHSVPVSMKEIRQYPNRWACTTAAITAWGRALRTLSGFAS